MKIVIDIPNWLYNAIMEHREPVYSHSLGDAVRDGTPLPKGHRGIVDLKIVQWAFDDAILEEAQRTGQVRATHNEIASILKTVPTIIEADKEESEDN